ncbi:efflux transporter, RND family, MFP subunit [Psychromonas ingrahamii 37]|uniref:Efflux transporter, RND family, MFP subunit n=1 Tax=Psychromonas ingrahamii (strain DSM 17664 / CCUG 51855 / 37) TaxID=357804 RepID=A1ST95_PSYIN|nr:efflux RND transporter periplasmic adaptor subunit [Psychromonas ingrahamii]ABM02710.1 efflux transporter, RND family, MFP subunit [Psychromonas ingrahamii 37]
MFARIAYFFSLRPYWLALLISLLLFLWMFSGSEENRSPTAVKKPQENFPQVQITHFIPRQMTKSLTLYAHSEAESHIIVRAEVAGGISKTYVEKGNYVEINNNLAEIDKNEHPFRFEQAKALLYERQLNYNAVKLLNAKGLQADIYLAEANSLLLAAKSNLALLGLTLKNTHITAPFTGVLQEKFVEQGDYVKVGDPLFSLENIDPIVFRGDTTEHYVNQLSLNQEVRATLLSAEVLTGKLTYIASMADPQSSTFRVEAQFANPNRKIFSGMSAQLSIPLYSVQAIYLSPSALALDKEGNLGVKLVQNERVSFKKINLVEADINGVWLTGFAGEVDIITLGQGFVKSGDRVQAIIVEK